MLSTTDTPAPAPLPSPLPDPSRRGDRGECRVVVVDRTSLDRDLLARVVGHSDGFALVGSVRSLSLVAETVVAGTPVDVVVIRASVPGTDLVAEVGSAAHLHPLARIVVLAAYVDTYLVDQLRAAGAHAVASSDVSLAEVLDLLRGSEAEPTPRPVDRSELGLRHHLTTRELEILDHLADGLAPGQIAHMLEVRVSTIRDHVKSLRSKLECTSATQLVVTAHRLGLVPHVGRPLR